MSPQRPSLTGADLAVVIPTRDRWPILARTLEALRHQTASGFETIVVVDGRNQDHAVIPPLGELRLLEKDHAGPGAARNAGAAATDRPVLLFLGDDMIASTDLIARHLAAHNEHLDDAVAVLGAVEWHAEVAGGRIERWLERSGTQFDFRSIAGSEAGYGHFYSCNVSLDRERFVEAGGFDEEFRFYYEDLDCGYRLEQKGMRLVFEPAARASHLHRYDLSSLERRFRGMAEGEHLMACRHPWFTPFFLDRVRAAAAAPPAARWWPLLVDALPAPSAPAALLGPAGAPTAPAAARAAGPAARLRTVAEARADTWYHQHLAPSFLAGWASAADLAELRRYLGDRYDHARLVAHRQEVDAERLAAADEGAFYRSSESYLYDLTAFAMSGTKAPYLGDLRAVTPAGTRLLDFGCGIGADGIRLAEAGYEVSFADYSNPSTEYLRWRLAQRGLRSPVFDLDRDEIPGGFDLAFSFDVIEHVDDPYDFLAALERRASLVMVNFLEEEEHDTDLHRPLPVTALLDHARRRGLVRYRRYHGRSHLVVYRSPGSGSSRRVGRSLRSVAERHLGAHRAGHPGWFPVPGR